METTTLLPAEFNFQHSLLVCYIQLCVCLLIGKLQVLDSIFMFLRRKFIVQLEMCAHRFTTLPPWHIGMYLHLNSDFF